jgi:hypothetical protein
VRVLSLGAGVQSTTTLLLSLDGVLPAFDHVVFADTQDEPLDVYVHLAKLQRIADIVTVTRGQLSETVNNKYLPIPLFLNGGIGQRQCTNQFKLRPIRQWLRTLNEPIDLAVCISTDEYMRAKDSGLKWCRNYFPLLDLGWSRQQCLNYLRENWPFPVPRSACVYCPLKSDREWLDLRENHPDDWQTAIGFDEKFRKFGYVHRSQKPLSEVVLRPEDAGQLTLECEGMCGV